MTTSVLTRDQLEALDTQGYLVLPGVLSPEDLRRARQCFEEAALRPPPPGRPPSARTGGTRHVEFRDGDFVLELPRRPAVHEAVRHILGDDFEAGIHGREPLQGHGLQGLHADAPFRPPNAGYHVVTAIWMLDDFTERNGATRVVPGSHKLPGSVPKPMAQPASVHPQQVIVTGKAGSVLVFNGHLWHGGTRNDSGEPRRALQNVFRRRGSPLFMPAEGPTAEQ